MSAASAAQLSSEDLSPRPVEPEIIKGNVINQIASTFIDVGEPHLSSLSRRLARVEIIARAYGASFFGKPYIDKKELRYKPYTLEPQTACSIAINLGRHLFFTCQLYEMIHPYSRSVLMALHGCDLSQPMISFSIPDKSEADEFAYMLSNSPDGVFLKGALSAYHHALAHIAQLLILPRGNAENSTYLLRALKQQPLFNIFGIPESSLIKFMKQSAEEETGEKRGQKDLLTKSLPSDSQYIGLVCFPIYGMMGKKNGGRSTENYLPNYCVDIWIGLNPSSNLSASIDAQWSDSEGYFKEYSQWIAPASVDSAIRRLVPKRQSSASAGALESHGDETTKRKGVLRKTLRTPPLKFIRILLVKGSLVFNQVVFASQMRRTDWQLLNRLSALSPSDTRIAETSGVIGDLMEWRRESILLGKVPYNTSPSNTAYFVFHFEDI